MSLNPRGGQMIPTGRRCLVLAALAAVVVGCSSEPEPLQARDPAKLRQAVSRKTDRAPGAAPGERH